MSKIFYYGGINYNFNIMTFYMSLSSLNSVQPSGKIYIGEAVLGGEYYVLYDKYGTKLLPEVQHAYQEYLSAEIDDQVFFSHETIDIK